MLPGEAAPVTRSTQQGLTLIELMMVITIAAVLIALAVPGFQALTRNSRQLNAVGDVSSMLSRARSEAAARYKHIVLCASADQATCSGATTWETGWIMFVDEDGSGTLNGTETTLQVGQALPSGSTLTLFYDGSPSTAQSTLGFAKGGLADTPAAFRYCIYRDSTAAMQGIDVNTAGQVRIATDSNSDGQVEDSSGNNITACP